MSTTSSSESVVSTGRILSAPPARVFAAFAQPELLARWWGPAGFTNTFHEFEFTPGGRWRFVMHDPNGADYHNESLFREIVPDARVVIEHVVEPWFLLTVTFMAVSEGTRLDWVQRFESPEVAKRMRKLSRTANEQNLDRLQSVLAGETGREP